MSDPVAVRGHPVVRWRLAFAASATSLDYQDWVEERYRANPDAYCRTCYEPYDGCGDGYDGECPSCADKTYAASQ
jgi:hypothetical protein